MTTRYNTFGAQAHSSGGSNSAYGYPTSTNDRVLENLNKASFLLNEPEPTTTYMDGYNVGFTQPNN
jgi:hypothetical protein